jgi:hypothetical protein
MMSTEATTDPRRGRALALLCAIYFIVILDAAIVGRAIHRDLGLSSAPAWHRG